MAEDILWNGRAVTFSPARAEDVEDLLTLRILVQREHLERVGRFDPERARARFLKSYVPEAMQLIHVDGEFAGCISLRDHGPDSDGETGPDWEIGHFYLHPDYQSGGLGSVVLKAVLQDTNADKRPVRLNVLIGSPANRFYQRHGFVEERRDDFDIYYIRRPI
jgi:GNAT superfamily N-acetyltransferase